MTKILLVDDDEVLVRMYQTVFENDTFKVETAHSGIEALQKTVSFLPDVILLDIMMPDISGFDVLSELKSVNQSTQVRQIPVIFLTNFGFSQEDADRGLQLGAAAYIIKAGNRPDSVLNKVKDILKNGHTSSKVKNSTGE